VRRSRGEICSGYGCLCLSVCLSVVCLSVCLSCLFLAACPHYCTDPDVPWGKSWGFPLVVVVHYWADLQSVRGFRCYDNIARTRNDSECLYSLYACLDLWKAHKLLWSRLGGPDSSIRGSTRPWMGCVLRTQIGLLISAHLVLCCFAVG